MNQNQENDMIRNNIKAVLYDENTGVVTFTNEQPEEPVVKNTRSTIKQHAKSLVRQRFKVGDTVILKSNVRDGSVKYVKKFVVRKTIWTVNDKIVNILILKQISGPKNTTYSLNKHDCTIYHIKYEPELQVYSMNMNFVKL